MAFRRLGGDAALRERLGKAAREKAAAAREGVVAGAEILQELPAAQIPGHERSELVQGAKDILRHLGIAPVASSRGSSPNASKRSFGSN